LGTASGVDNVDLFLDVVNANAGRLAALPNTAVTTNASLITSGTGTDQISNSSGKVLLQATQTGVTIPTVTTVTNQLTAAQIATGVWQDTTSGDFTVASSIGKSLFTSGNAPGAASGLALVGSNMGTVSSVTGAVGSVTGNVGGSVASVTAPVEVGSYAPGEDPATLLSTDFAAIPTANQNADALLARNIAGGSSSGRIVSQALYALRNKWVINESSGVMTIYGTDDATTAWTTQLTSASGATPISESAPTS
jgi:hypothetical protein